MCTSYRTGKDIDFRAMFDVDAPTDEWRDEVYKDYAAPIVLADVPGARVARLATFGIVPRLGCRDPELARTFFRLPHEDEMTAEAAPLPPRKPARPSGNESNDLFGHP
jgi:hypothetical protein